MSLKKSIVVEQTGAPALIHRVDNVTINYLASTTSAQISSFYDDEAKKVNRAPLASVSLSVEGIPKSGKDAKAFVEAALAAPVPEGENAEALLRQYGTNRYAFAGADIVAD
ncbi:hypothetical protein L3V59_21195 [Burkholderia aenigmatica]|uniref:hypothetical protein n=1 Tax=Burkholderia aenigmatica TaxID=2015348 RepID=UPI001F26B117|nr:hypothetical protein [Burkholderia aenigmatica]UKD15467.1 hypothetical protein L3V59_21195 [Burkholderia aenigmatica]